MRKFISVLLALMLVFSLTTVAFSAYNVVDDDALLVTDVTAEYDGPLARVYFMMPNGHNGDFGSDGTQPVSWLNDFNVIDGVNYAGIYWWGGFGACSSWPGYRMEVENAEEGIYYADIPGDGEITTVVFNNGVDGGMDPEDPIYDKANQVADVNVEGAYPGDYDTIPEGSINEFDFDGFIYIVDQDQVDENPVSHRLTAGGNWYAYYGNGCYGNYAESQDGFVSVEENCLNPNHHHGEEPTEPAPTEPAPTEPAPTEPAPTEPAPEPTAEPVPEDVVIVAGNATSIFGTAWNGNDANNTMTKGEDGKYTKEYTVDAAMTDVQLKAVKNGAEWIGDETGNNVTFNLTGAGTFTVTYDPEANVTSVSGDIVDIPSVFEYEYVAAVGNGAADGDTWLNNVAWDPAAEANKMTETSEGVWEFETAIGEYDTNDIEFKFAVDGAWTHNFGVAEGAVVENGVETDAAYNGNNIIFNGVEAGTTVKMVLDLSNFDFGTKTGAKMTITLVPAEEPTEPAPTEPAPTEPAPTEPAPEPTAEPVPEDVVIVAGNATSIFGTAWNGNDANNTMTKGEDGKYTKEYTVDAAMTDVQLKAVKNGAEWIGDETGNNVTFNLTGAGTFTVTYDPEANVTSVSGDIVDIPSVFEYEYVAAVGNGATDGDTWLNNVAWDPAAEANKMTETSDDVWEFESKIGEFDTNDIQFKFAVDGAWTHNFGLAEDATVESGVETDAAYNGNNIAFEGVAAGTTVKMVLDLSNFDFGTKTGAKMTITLVPAEEPTEPAPTEPAPTEPEPEPQLKPNTYYLWGSIASVNQNWELDPALELTEVEKDSLYKIEHIVLTKAELGVDQFGNPIKNSDPDGPEILGDNFKIVKSSKRGTSISAYYPDGVENNRTVPEDGTYTIWFRPNGDGTAEDGWQYIYNKNDPEGDPAAHGCSNGGYMYKFVKEGDEPTPGAYILGDADGNEEVEIADATLVQRADAQMKVPYELEQMMHADVDGDGELSIIDVTLIQRYLGKIGTNKYGIGEWVNP